MNTTPMVLVLSSSAADRGGLCSILDSRGYVTAGVTPGFHVLGYVASAKPDLVLYDVHDLWPEAVHLLRSIRDLSPGTCMIAVRERPTWKMFWDVVDAGAADLLPKPYTEVQLVAAMDLAMGKVSA